MNKTIIKEFSAFRRQSNLPTKHVIEIKSFQETKKHLIAKLPYVGEQRMHSHGMQDPKQEEYSRDPERIEGNP